MGREVPVLGEFEFMPQETGRVSEERCFPLLSMHDGRLLGTLSPNLKNNPLN